MTKSLRLAVIGGGHLGRIHAKLATGNDHFELVAVADPCPTACEVVHQQLGLPTTTDYRSLIGSIDAAIVAAPTTAHYEITSTLLRAGVHVLVEKPLALSSDQAQRLVQMARSHQRTLQTGHVERFNSAWAVAQNHLGSPKFIESVRAGSYSGRSTDIGVVMDLMIHDIDLVLSLDSSPLERISASGLALLGTHEDIAEARLEFASGLIANLRASRVATAPSRRMQLYTSTCFADINFSGDTVELIKPAAETLDRSVSLDELPAEARMRAKELIFEHYLHCESLPAPQRNAILDEQIDFALSIHTGTAPAVSGEDGARAVEVASQVVETLQQRQWDGKDSKPWRVGALATFEPRILPLPSAAPSAKPQDDQRRAG